MLKHKRETLLLVCLGIPRVTAHPLAGKVSAMRIALIPNFEKADALAAGDALCRVLRPRAEVVTLRDPQPDELRQLAPELVIVLGGDGSILRCAHALSDLAVPVAGVNFGKLGYLAAFSMEQFERHLPEILAGRARITSRLMLHGAIHICSGAGGMPEIAEVRKRPANFEYVALNDIVINAGPPFRMIELHVRVDDEETTQFRSDGVIISTSSGSTAYNLSAGGPLVTPDVQALVLTPICPHSLSFRSVVLSDQVTMLIFPEQVNAGTAVSFDGQVTRPLGMNECVVVRRAKLPLKLVENPELSHWRMLATKLQWAVSPRQ